MRAVVQRVSRARVTVDGAPVGAVERGLLVYVGVANEDGPADVQYIATKVRELRVFEDEAGKMNRSFDGAAPPALARALYEDVVRALREAGVPVETGSFQAHMAVESVNDGPVTLLLDSGKKF